LKTKSLVKRQPNKWSANAHTLKEWCCVCSYIWHEVFQILHESQEVLDFVVITRLSPVSYSLHFIDAGMETCIGDDMVEAIHLLGIEIDLVASQVQLSLSHLLNTVLRCCSCSSIVGE